MLLILMLLAGCAGSKEAMAPHPLAGMWDYAVDTPQGVYTGALTFMQEEGALKGTISSSDAPGQAMPLDGLTFDAESGALSFSFDGGEFGNMDVSTTLQGDGLKGLMTVSAYGVDVPITATRKTP